MTITIGKKDTEIEEIYTSRAPLGRDAGQDIFIIHGFWSSGYRYYRDIVESWALERAKNLSTPSTVYVLRFDGPGIPYRGKAVLESAVWELRLFLLRLLRETADHELVDDETGPESEQEEDACIEDDQSTTDASMTLPTNRRIIFVAHGLGSWIVKDVLAHRMMDSITYTYDRVDLKFLDTRTGTTVRNLDDPYRAYLKRNWATFSLGSPKYEQGTIYDQLVSYLQETDDNFDTFAETHSAAEQHSITRGDPRPSTIYKDPDHRVWMSDDDLIVRIEPSIADRIVSRLISGGQSSAVRRPSMKELPTSLEATQRFAPQSLLRAPGLSQTSTPPESPTKTSSHQHVGVRSPASVMPSEGYSRDTGHLTPPETGIDELQTTHIHPAGKQDGASPQYQRSDEDSASLVSIPDRDFMSSTHIASACKLAKDYLQKGELQTAATLFNKALAHMAPHDQSVDRIVIAMQLAAARMYCGFYELAMEDLHKIKESLEKAKSTIANFDNLTYNCQRWLASCLLYAGRLKEAADQMQALIDNDTGRYHVRLYRDQALAYAFLGQYQTAWARLRLAKENASRMRLGLSRQDTSDMSSFAAEMGGSSNDDHGMQNKVTTRDEKERRVKKNTLKVAQARIEILTGDYSSALRDSSEALGYLKGMVGSKHFKTLETATIKAWSLAYNGQYNEAETLCSTTYRATKAALGRNHPQTLEIAGCLIYVYRSQGRFAEAVGTGMSTTSISQHGKEDVRDHPYHIHVEFQLAQSFLANGDYLDSKSTFDKLIQRAEKVMGEIHPITLRYKAEQARVLLSLGSFPEARHLACSVAIRQFHIYNKNLNQSTDISHICETLLFAPPDSATCLSRLASLLEKCLEDSSLTQVLHPYLLITLQLIANIEIRQFQLTGRHQGNPKPDLAAAQRILTSLHTHHLNKESAQEAASATPGHNTDHPINRLPSASTALDLATLLKEQPNMTTTTTTSSSSSDTETPEDTDLSKSIALYQYAHTTRKQILDDNHLTTLLAQRDLTIAKTLYSGQNSDGDIETSFSLLRRVKSVSDCLYKKLESRLGVLHPETLIMRLWCFTVDLLVEHHPLTAQIQVEQRESQTETDTKQTRKEVEVWKEINTTLTDPQVVEQRLVESLAMRRQLSGLLSRTGRMDEALVVVLGALGDIKRGLMLETGASSRDGGGGSGSGGGEDEKGEEKEGLDADLGEQGLKETLSGLQKSFETLREDCLAEGAAEPMEDVPLSVIEDGDPEKAE